MTNSEQLFTWDDYGLSLHIPENSLPDNLQQCSIHIKADIMEDCQLPRDTHLISAVYCLDCVPECRFSQPLTLEIQHCAKPENVSKLCFVRSSSVEHHEKGVNLETVEGHFPISSSYGFIELNSFSKYRIHQKGVKDRKYCARCYYYEDHNQLHKIYFNVTWNTKSHNSVIYHACLN